MAVKDWSTSPASNTSIDGLDIGEGCPAANMNNAVRSVMAGVKKTLAGIYNVMDYGAAGDGTTNDTTAFQAAAAALEAAGGGTIVIPPGTYIVGTQTLAGATGLDYAYQISDVIDIRNCTKPIRIVGHGAILKAASGLKYGSFNPVTGAAAGTSTDEDFRAYGVNFISVVGNSSVSIEGLEIDGNVDGYTLGGAWGDSGRQIGASGISSEQNDQLSVTDCYIHHCPLDGILIGYTGLAVTDDRKPHTIINVRSEYNGRQAPSVVGSNGLTCISCAYNHTGKNSAGVSTSPAAGIDMEAEAAVNRGAMFINCEGINNVGAGFIAHSGDSAEMTLIRCKFVGTTYYAIYPNKPAIKMHDCRIYGQWTAPYSSADIGEATQFFNCVFSMKLAESMTGALYNSNSHLADFGSAQNVLFQNCLWDTGGVTTATLPSSTVDTIYRDNTFVQDGTGVAFLKGIFLGRNTITTAGTLDNPGSTYAGYTTLNGTVQGWLNGVSDASTAHALNATFSDVEVETALNDLGTKINTIISRLESAGILAV